MKPIVLVIVLLSLTACGGSSGSSSSTPVSLLSGYNVYYAGSTLYLSSNGTFIFNQTSPTSCSEGGTWQDMNPGSSIGQIQFINISNSCTTFSKSLDNYIISNGELILTLISH